MPGATIDVRAVADAADLAEQAAAHVAQAVRDTLKRKSFFNLALCGGTTPLGLYGRLARPPYDRELPWHEIHVFWGDERFVPPAHPDSNFQAARRALLDHVSLPPDNVHRIETEGLTLEESAQAYERTLRRQFGEVGFPAFDLTLLGLGADGHTASLFAGFPALEEKKRWVATVKNAPKPPPERITLTLPVLRSSRRIALLVSGPDKAKPLNEALSPSGPDSPARRLLQPPGDTDNYITIFSDSSRSGSGS